MELFGSVVDGSSPRAWGTGLHGGFFFGQRRFIPTGVGNGAALLIAVCFSAVHPHGRGERITRETYILNNAGSSPRAWGTDDPA